jgi:hypothetical protein
MKSRNITRSVLLAHSGPIPVPCPISAPALELTHVFPRPPSVTNLASNGTPARASIPEPPDHNLLLPSPPTRDERSEADKHANDLSRHFCINKKNESNKTETGGE